MGYLTGGPNQDLKNATVINTKIFHLECNQNLGDVGEIANYLNLRSKACLTFCRICK